MSEEKTYKERSRREVLSFMSGLSICAGEIRAAEGYLLELLACLAFTEWDETATHISA